MDDHLGFLTSDHRLVRNFVVRELPRHHGRPIGADTVAQALRLELGHVVGLLDDLEQHLFFLVRNARGAVNWAFPVTTDPTPHRLRFSSGERIFGA